MKAPIKNSGDEPASIAAGTSARGDLHGDESLSISGRFEGAIDLGAAELSIERGAVVKAELQAGSIRIAGLFIGTALAKTIHLAPTAKIQGELEAARIMVEPGAEVSGMIEGAAGGDGVRLVPWNRHDEKPHAFDSRLVPPLAEDDDDEEEASFAPVVRDEPKTELPQERRRRLVVKVRRRGL